LERNLLEICSKFVSRTMHWCQWCHGYETERKFPLTNFPSPRFGPPSTTYEVRARVSQVHCSRFRSGILQIVDGRVDDDVSAEECPEASLLTAPMLEIVPDDAVFFTDAIDVRDVRPNVNYPHQLTRTCPHVNRPSLCIMSYPTCTQQNWILESWQYIIILIKHC
jgi:hypothetical protein